MLLALGTARAALGGEPYEQGQVLGRVELRTPDAERYVLRATLPLPRHLYPRADGRSPFALRGPTGHEGPAQVEVVSWYADDQSGADVVELLAEVARPADHVPGQWVAYEVVWSPHFQGELELDPQVAELLGSPQRLVLRARDVFGHEYRADLLRDRRLENAELRVLRDGAFAHTVRTHETLLAETPAGGPTGTLPHFLGAHAFVTAWDEQTSFTLDLRVHNGHDGLDPQDDEDDALGKLYFRELELLLPTGWKLFVEGEDPMFGEPYDEGQRTVWPLVAPMPDGTLHMMPRQGQLQRRLVVTRQGHELAAKAHLRHQTLAFCRPGTAADGRELFSWWNADTARYFPQKERLPELWHVSRPALWQQLDDRFRLFASVLRDGAGEPYPVMVENLGWAHPWGLDIGYAHGGDEIHLFDGLRTAYAASSEGYRLFQLIHRMTTERQPLALFDGDGEAFTLEDWLVDGPNGPYLPVYLWMYPVLFLGDPFGFGDSPDFQRQAVDALGLRPPYEEELSSYEPIDRAHLVRYTRAPKVLAWLGNDPLAKDDLRLMGELARASYTILPQDPWGGYIYTGLRNDRVNVDANPGTGVAVHRGEGWGADAMVAAYCLADPEWRAKTRPWFYDVLELIEDGAAECTGIVQGDPNLDTFHGDYRSRQSISAAILENAFWGMMQSVFGERDPGARERLAAVLRADLYAMLSPIVWNHELNAPWFYVAVGPYDLAQPPFCHEDDFPPDGYLYTDAYQTWCAFAYGYRLTNDPVFLQFAEAMLGQPLTTPNLGAMQHGFLENRVALLALIQELFE